MAYQLLFGLSSVLRTTDQAVIPNDLGNRDWIEYQAWLAAGNTPLAAAPIVRPVVLTASSFLARFTAAEQSALWTALSTRPQALGALMLHIADGSVDLSAARVSTLLDQLVTAGVLATARKTTILTP